MITLFLFLQLASLVFGHGRLIKPMTRVGHTNYENDPVPNGSSTEWICRHGTPKTPTSVNADSTLDIQWSFSANHVGDCEVYVSYDYDAPRENMRWFKIANYLACRDQNRQDVPLKLPSWLKNGRAVLRWTWYALHVSAGDKVEFYAQCSDIEVSNGANQLPNGLVTYAVAGLHPERPSIAPGYRDPFGNNPLEFLTGPPCAQGMTDNSCALTAAGTKGHLAISESPTLDPVDITPNPTKSPNTSPDPVPTEAPPVNDCASGEFQSKQSHIGDQWCQDTCTWNMDFCDPDVCECKENGNSGTTTITTDEDPTAPPTEGTPAARRVIYLDWKLTWSDFASDITASVNMGFNVIILAFYLDNAPADAAVAWQDLTPGKRQEVKQFLAENDAKLLLSAGGATFNAENKISQGVDTATTWCAQASNYALQYDYDGVDFDIELSPGNNTPFRDETAINWLVECSRKAREVLGADKLISHAPQAPYFGTWAGDKLGYTEVYRLAPDAIDFFNIQYYNQGTGAYTTYREIFVASTTQPETAIREIHANGVPLEKLVVGKPTDTGMAGSGYVTGDDLFEFGLTACGAFGWNAGFMGWMYEPNDSELQGWAQSLSGNMCDYERVQNNRNDPSAAPSFSFIFTVVTLLCWFY